MDNIEFCNLVKEAKKMSGVSNVDLVVALKKSERTLNHMLKPKGDYSTARYLPFLDAIGFCIVVSNNQNSAEISNEEDLYKWVNNVLSSLNLSSHKLGALLGISNSTAYSIMTGGAVRLSIFLKLVEISKSKITLDAIL